MANETEVSNFALTTDVISDAISPALVQAPVVAPHIYYEALPAGTNVKLWRKAASVTAAEINESAIVTPQEPSESTVTATVVKLGGTILLTVEAQRVGASQGDMVRLLAEAIGRDWDDEIIALFASISNQVTATTTLTINDVLEAAYNVRANTAGVSSGPLVGVFDYKGIHEIQKELTGSTAAHLSNASEISLLQGVGANGYVGEKSGVYFYQTDGLPTSGSDDNALVYDPAITFGGMISPSVETRINFIGGEGPTRGFADSINAWIFCDVIEWNDGAGCGILSDS